ncbi:hypothetical protein FACS189459_0680 [Bacilli bacterium]|nr:hypothetical protein FACS189459_0680 [Bacilli bacterium]
MRVFEIIGFVPSESYVMHDTINEFLNYVGKLNNLTNKQISERTQLFAKLFNLTNKLDYKFNTLSLGEQKKVMIIQSVLHDPEIIIMDEPTNALDNESLREFTSFIKYLKELNKTVIFSSHDINSINNFGVDKIIYISNGKIIKNDILDEDVGARLNKYSKDNNDTPYVPTDIKTKSIYNKK